MAMQQQRSSLAAKMGGRLSAANAAVMDKPINVGFQRLPPGIRNGVAKLTELEWVEEEEDNKSTPKGQLKCRMVAVVVFPKEFAGEITENRQIFKTIPLCDVAEKKGDTWEKAAVKFEDNFAEFTNLMKWWGISPCRETPLTDPTGDRAEAYWKAAMSLLTDPQRSPTYIQFTTEGFTPKATPKNPTPDKVVIEKWRGLATEKEVAMVNGQFNPATAMTQMHNAATTQLAQQPRPSDNPPVIGADGLPNLPPEGDEGEQVGVEVGSVWNFVKRGVNGEKLVDKDNNPLPSFEVEVTQVFPGDYTCFVKRVSDGKDLIDIRTKKPVLVKWEWLE